MDRTCDRPGQVVSTLPVRTASYIKTCRNWREFNGSKKGSLLNFQFSVIHELSVTYYERDPLSPPEGEAAQGVLPLDPRIWEIFFHPPPGQCDSGIGHTN